MEMFPYTEVCMRDAGKVRAVQKFPSTVCAECMSNQEKKCWHARAAKNASMGLVKHCLQLHIRIGFVAGARNYLRYYYIDCRRFSLLTMMLCKYLITATCGGVMWDGCSCASCLLMNLPHNVHIPARLACRRPFRAIPADYPTNTEVEARERASADDLYYDQQVSACCGKEQLLGKGRAYYTMVYLRIASGRITTTSMTLFQSVLRGCRAFTHASPPINCALVLSLSSRLAHFSLCINFSLESICMAEARHVLCALRMPSSILEITLCIQIVM